jgi:hypothetical protein
MRATSSFPKVLFFLPPQGGVGAFFSPNDTMPAVLAETS